MSISSLRAASSGGAIAKPVIAKQAEEANNDIIFNTQNPQKFF